MIARMWRGWVHTERIEEYVDIVERTGMAGYRATAGNQGAQLLTRDLGDGRTELITLSWWDDLDQIRAFAGTDIAAAKYYPEDDEYLVDRETTVAHFEVAPPHPRPDSDVAERTSGDESAAFTLTRVLAGTRAEVFAYFTDPELFSRWFVVDGFTTPLAQVALDARSGGSITGMMVSERDGTEIPFSATYGTVEPPGTVQFAFTDPTELVTITLLDLGEAGTQLTYRNDGSPLEGRAESLAGVDGMLDALKASLTADDATSIHRPLP